MAPDILRSFFRSGVFLVMVSAILILALPRNSAEFVVSVCTLFLGVTLLGLITLVNRLTR